VFEPNIIKTLREILCVIYPKDDSSKKEALKSVEDIPLSEVKIINGGALNQTSSIMEDLKILIKYLLLDLEATRRERDLINQRNDQLTKQNQTLRSLFENDPPSETG
jgi:hypothetical protein